MPPGPQPDRRAGGSCLYRQPHAGRLSAGGSCNASPSTRAVGYRRRL
jgi:hypothetical protein